MKAKKSVLCLIIIFVMTIVAGLLQGCQNDDVVEKIDPKRTQLYIGNYNGGYGYKWLLAYKERFEELYKDEEFEPGKKGVQIMIENDKDAFVSERLLQTIKNDTNEIYFISGDNYHDFVVNNLLLDITDVVNSSLSKYGEDKTVKDKIWKIVK